MGGVGNILLVGLALFMLWEFIAFSILLSLLKNYKCRLIKELSFFPFWFFLGFTPSPVAQPHPSAGLNVDFESVFGNKSANVIVDSGGKKKLFY